MELVLSEGEKVYYSRDYCKGKSNITITDKRLISAVRSKKQLTRKEFLVEEISGVGMRFRPVSIVSFILSGILGLIGLAFKLFENVMRAKEMIPEGAETIGTIFNVYVLVLLALAVLNFIIGLLSLRSGYYIVIKAKVCGYIGVTSLSAMVGKVRPIKLRPNKKDAFEMMNDIPSTLALVRSETLKK